MAIAIKQLQCVNFAQYEPQLDRRSVGIGMVPYGLMAVGLIASARMKGMIGTRMAVVASLVAALVSILIADSHRTSTFSSLRQKIEEGRQLHSSLNNLHSKVNEDITKRFSERDVTTKEALNEVINSEMRIISVLVDGIPFKILSPALQNEIASIKKKRNDMSKIFETIYKTNQSEPEAVEILRKKVVEDLTSYSNLIADTANRIGDLQERYVEMLKENAESY